MKQRRNKPPLGFEPVLTLSALVFMDLFSIFDAPIYRVNGLAYTFLIFGWCVAGFLLMHLIWRMIQVDRSGKR